MRKWKLPRYYSGATWDGYYVSLGQHRDSDAVDRSNFRAAWDRLNSIPGSEDARGEELLCIVRENHWAVGWVEWIAIHESLTAHVEEGNRIAAKLEDYPVLDEEALSALEFEEGGVS